MKLGRELWNRRIELNLAITEVARCLEISIVDYSDIEHGRMAIESQELISKLSKLYDIPEGRIVFLNTLDKDELLVKLANPETEPTEVIEITRKGAHPWGFVD